MTMQGSWQRLISKGAQFTERCIIHLKFCCILTVGNWELDRRAGTEGASTVVIYNLAAPQIALSNRLARLSDTYVTALVNIGKVVSVSSTSSVGEGATVIGLAIVGESREDTSTFSGLNFKLTHVDSLVFS